MSIMLVRSKSPVCATQLRGGTDYISHYTGDFKLIIQVWEGGLQAGRHMKPGSGIQRLRHRPAESKTIREHGFGVFEISLLNDIQEGLYSLSIIHEVSFMTMTKQAAN